MGLSHLLTLIICNCTPSSVCGPLKQPHIVSTMRSISLLPGVVLSGALPTRCPYAINFYKDKENTVSTRFKGWRKEWANFLLWGRILYKERLSLLSLHFNTIQCFNHVCLAGQEIESDIILVATIHYFLNRLQ